MWVPRLSVVLLLVRKASEKCENVVWKASTQLKKKVVWRYSKLEVAGSVTSW